MDMNFEWHTRAEKLLVVAYWWKEQKAKCCICQCPMLPYLREHTSDPNRATVEHLIPRRDSGPNTAGNVRLAHARCNHALGALWGINKQREKYGKAPLSQEWALKHGGRLKPGGSKPRPNRPPMSALQLMTAEENDRRMRDYLENKTPKQGVSWNAGNALSLPRGATLMPEYLDKIVATGPDARTRMNAKAAADQVRARRAHRMTAEETARWLTSQGVRGA